MSTIGSPIETSLLQAAQAQQAASRSKDKEKAAEESKRRRFQDLVDLRVAAAEEADPVRGLPHNESEEAEAEHREGKLTDFNAHVSKDDEDERPSIDVTG